MAQIPPPPSSAPNPTQPPDPVPIASGNGGPLDAETKQAPATKFGATPEQWGGYFRHILGAIGAAVAADPSIVSAYLPPPVARYGGIITTLIAIVLSHTSKK
jgi:hypothetical protein